LAKHQRIIEELQRAIDSRTEFTDESTGPGVLYKSYESLLRGVLAMVGEESVFEFLQDCLVHARPVWEQGSPDQRLLDEVLDALGNPERREQDAEWLEGLRDEAAETALLSRVPAGAVADAVAMAATSLLESGEAVLEAAVNAACTLTRAAGCPSDEIDFQTALLATKLRENMAGENS